MHLFHIILLMDKKRRGEEGDRAVGRVNLNKLKQRENWGWGGRRASEAEVSKIKIWCMYIITAT